MFTIKKKIISEKKVLMGITTLVGTIVGAGMLGIPYVVAKAGVLYGLFLIIFLGLIFMFLNLFAGEVVLRTEGMHQLTGYAEKYLGITGKRFMFFSMLVNIYGALIAYLIGEGAILHSIFGFGSPIFYTLIFFIIASLIVYKGVKATGNSELILIFFLILVVILISIFSFKNINLSNFNGFNSAYFFLPYGVILFAFMATPSIPEIKEVLANNKKDLKKVIMIGSFIPIVLYLVFAIVVIGVVGLNNFETLLPNEKIATVALSIYSIPILGNLANVLAILAMFTSFLTLSLALVQMYEYDYKYSRNMAFFLTFSIPLIISLLKLTSFISVLSVTGAIAGGIDGILVVLMFWIAKKNGDRNPEYSLKNHYFIGSFILILFLIGIVQQVWINLF